MKNYRDILQRRVLAGLFFPFAFLSIFLHTPSAGADNFIEKIPEGLENTEEHRILHVRGDHNYPPYEYLNEQGRPDGFNVDIIKAVADTMGLRIRIDLGPWDEVRSELEKKEIDALIGMFQTRERDKNFDFSIPHFIASYAVFVRDDSPIRSIKDVKNKKILVQLSDLGHDYLKENDITSDIVVKKNWSEVLKSLAKGEGDCAIVSRLQGTWLIGKLAITNIKAVGSPIIQRKYCLAVTEGNSTLLAKLNEGLSIIKETGRYDEIYTKWFGVYEERPLSFARIIQYLIWIVLPLLLLTITGFLWSWTLKKKVNLRIIDLQNELHERKKAEEALRTTNELLSLFIRHSPIYAFIKEVSPSESRTLHASENYVDMVGIPGSEMAGKTMPELFPAEFAEKITADDWLVASRGEILRLDEDFNGRNYTTIKFPILLGEKTLLAGYTIDITERKRAEEELRRRENQLQKIFEILPIGLWCTDRNGTLQRGNPMGVKIWGGEPRVPISELGIFKAWRLPSREPVKPEDWALVKTIREGVTIVDELLEIESFDGKRKIILNYSTPVLDDNGNIEGAIVVNLDISDRKNLEDKLLHAQKMETIGQLAGGVAHDFNNMLSVILGHTELALTLLDPAQPLFSSLQNIHQAAQRSANLTRQLLAFARRQTVAPKVLDLNETVEGLLKMLLRLIGEDIDLIWLPCQNPSLLKMDPTQIDQILVNLCVNARDSIGDTGTIVIETNVVVLDTTYCDEYADLVPGEYVLLSVSDNGCGMDPETIAHLFEPFYTTKETGKGTGLGLATVYGIVTQNKGFIKAYSEPGQGTTFKIHLPRCLTKIERTAQGDMEKPSAPGVETILLVEDEPMILDLTMAMLKRLGYTVLPAVTPEEAIRLAGEHAGQIHLLFTDVIMPEMNGRDLAKNLLSLYPNLKRLFMSGYTADVIAHHGVLDEGVHFIQKPFTMADLAKKVRESLDTEDMFY
jgi:signal transduction histidine kinase/ABC-type amino acid transport substrate-binding protein/CheY-like chemotaxis protein